MNGSDNLDQDEPVSILPDLDFSHLSLTNNKENVESEKDHEMIDTHQNEAEMNVMEEIVNKENYVLNPNPQKLRRGKRSMDKIEPERKSARLASKVPPNPEESYQAKKTGDGKRLWKNFEKIQLLTGLKSHGSKEYKAVASCVPTKSEEMVKAYIKREKRNHLFTTKTVFKHDDGTEIVIDEGEKCNSKTGKKPQSQSKDVEAGPGTKPEGHVEEKLVRRKKNNPVEQWLEIIEKNDDNAAKINAIGSGPMNYSSVVPSSLNWIANNELHPSPEDCGGVNYSAIYKYLACLCQGEAPPDLDPPTAAKVLTLLPIMAGVVKKMDLEKEKRWLENYRGIHSGKSYVREEGFDVDKESVKNIEGLGKFPGLNPLGIDTEVCVDRVVYLSNGH